MTNPEYYERIPVASVADTGIYTPVELLYSTVGYTQKGVTLKAGQGVLKAGTILTRGSDKKYHAYTGTGLPAGLLRRSVDLGTATAAQYDQLSNLVITGIVKYDVVQAANSQANINSATGARSCVVDTARNSFMF